MECICKSVLDIQDYRKHSKVAGYEILVVRHYLERSLELNEYF